MHDGGEPVLARVSNLFLRLRGLLAYVRALYTLYARLIDSKRLRSADSRASGGGPRVLHLFTAFPSHTEHLEGRSSSGEVRTLACRAVAHRAYCICSQRKQNEARSKGVLVVCALLLFFSGAPRPRPTTHTLTQLRQALSPPFVELVELSHTLAHLTLSPPVHRVAPAVCRSTPPAPMPSQTSPLSVTDDAQTLSLPHVRFSSSTHTASSAAVEMPAAHSIKEVEW